MTATSASRNAALLRAGVAVAAAIALLVGVLAQEEQGAPSAAPKAPAAAGPAATAPAAVKPAVAEGATTALLAASVEAAQLPPVAAAPAGQVVAEGGPATAVPAAIEAAPPSMAAVTPTPTEMQANVRIESPADTSTQPAAAGQTTAPAKDGYLLQLGVFGNPRNAGSLQAELAKKGLPARVESRVVLGPFPDRKALEAAQRRLKREHRLEGVVVPPRNGR